jgi:hypothetical protein
MDTWERDGIVEAGQREVIRSHVNSCEECRRNFSTLLPFVMEETGKLRDIFDPVEVPLDSLSDIIAGNLSQKKLPKIILGMRLPLAVSFFALVPLIAFWAFFINNGGQEPSIEIRFILEAPQAESVFLVGDFNEWNEFELELTDPEDDGVWEKTVHLRKGSIYLYNFVIDGEEWIPDPGSQSQVDDGFGGLSSILQL